MDIISANNAREMHNRNRDRYINQFNELVKNNPTGFYIDRTKNVEGFFSWLLHNDKLIINAGYKFNFIPRHQGNQAHWSFDRIEIKY